MFSDAGPLDALNSPYAVVVIFLAMVAAVLAFQRQFQAKKANGETKEKNVPDGNVVMTQMYLEQLLGLAKQQAEAAQQGRDFLRDIQMRGAQTVEALSRLEAAMQRLSDAIRAIQAPPEK